MGTRRSKAYRNEEPEIVEHIQALINLFDMDKIADAPISSYSAGQRKKAELIVALAPETPVLVLDEPFSGGLDPTGLYAIKEILRRRAHIMGHTILLATPTPELVEEIADRIIILRTGEIAAQGSLAELQQQSGYDGSLVGIYEKLSSSEIETRLQEYQERYIVK